MSNMTIHFTKGRVTHAIKIFFFSRDLQFVMNCLILKGTHNQFVMNCLTLKGTHKFQPVTERLDPNICLEFH